MKFFLFPVICLLFLTTLKPAPAKDFQTLLDSTKFYQEKQDYETALVWAKKAEVEAKEKYGERDTNYADVTGTMSELFFNLGKVDSALNLAELRLRIFRKIHINDHKNLASTINDLAYLYKITGDYVKAEPLYIESTAMRRRLFKGDNPDLANSINNMAGLYNDKGDYRKAEPLYVEAMEMRRRLFKSDHKDLANSISNFGAFYDEVGDYPRAELLFMEALEMRRRLFKGDHPDLANSINNLAVFYDVKKDYKKAEPLYEESTQMMRRMFKTDHHYLAICINNLASFYNDKGDFSKSEKLFTEVLEMYRRIYKTDHPDIASCINNLAGFYKARGDYQQAEKFYIESLVMRRRIFKSDHPDLANSINNLAGFYYFIGNNAKAENLYLEALSIYEKIINYYFPSLSESEKDKFWRKFNNRFDAFSSFATIRIQQNPLILQNLFDNYLLTKGILLSSTQKVKRNIFMSGNSELTKKYQEWHNIREKISKIITLSPEQIKDYYTYLDSLMIIANAKEKELSGLSDIFAKEFYHKKSYWHDIRKALKPDEAAVEIVRFKYYDINKSKMTDTVYYAALIVRGSGPRIRDSVNHSDSGSVEMVLLENGKELEGKLYRDYLKCVTLSEEDKNNVQKFNHYQKNYKKNLQTAYRHYWAKIQDNLKGINKVYLSVDGVYNKINLNTLIAGNGSYLIENTDIHLITSTRDIVNIDTKKDTSKLAVLFGRPNYNTGFDKITKTKSKKLLPDDFIVNRGGRLQNTALFEDLPYSEKEVKIIGRLFSTYKIEIKTFLRNSASEEALKSLESPKVLHIATHGFFEEDVKRSYDDKDTKQGILDNPLLRSGLVFAGANNTIRANKKKEQKKNQDGEDGILTAYEVMNLFLDNTDLVVLSACETGLGEIKNGEGVYGLQRAFKVAGARNLIMSLWNVSDEASQKLMTSFYKKYLKRSDIHGSLRQAQIEMLKSGIYSEPRFWGGFIHVGN